jgi:hypothetical protein
MLGLQAHDRSARLDTGRKRNNAGGPPHQLRAMSQPPVRRSIQQQQQRRTLPHGAVSSVSSAPMSPPGPLEAAALESPASMVWSSPAAASDDSRLHLSDSEAMTAARVEWLSEESPLPLSTVPSPLALVTPSDEPTMAGEEQQEEAEEERHAVNPAMFDTAMDQTSLAQQAAATKAMQTEEQAAKQELERRQHWMESLKLQIAEAEHALTMERLSPLAKLPNVVRSRCALVPVLSTRRYFTVVEWVAAIGGCAHRHRRQGCEPDLTRN